MIKYSARNLMVLHILKAMISSSGQQSVALLYFSPLIGPFMLKW